jgi:predicted alpha/beta hydrolase family esterase
MKVFLNNHISDPLLYSGNLRELVLLSVIQASCWMNYGEWDQYPNDTDQYCSTSKSPEYARQLAEDDIIIVTHSLGSRIAVDAWQYAVEEINSAEVQGVLEGKGYYGPEEIRNVRLFLDGFKQKAVPLFMLANQLPLLPVTGKPDQYCQPEGSHYTQRLFKQLRIVAFSDPNDLFSYAIPPKYADENMDSRLCPGPQRRAGQ